MIPEAEPQATTDLLKNIPKERILGKFSHPRRERPTPRSETSLVTKTRVPLGFPLGMPLGIRFVGIMWGGGGDR
jgi:hypothetical protein